MNKNFCAIVISVFCSLISFSQEGNIIYEQKVLDYFTDSIVGINEPFKNCKVHFAGEVDSNITTINFDLTYKYPEDSELKKQYEIAEKANNDFWINNKKKTFELTLKHPIKKKCKKNYGRRSKVVRLMIFQNKQVGQRNYIQIRTFERNGYQGHNIMFVSDINGVILDWTMESFIF